MAFDADKYDPDAPVTPTAVTFTHGKKRAPNKKTGFAGQEPIELTLERYSSDQAADLCMNGVWLHTYVTDLNIYPRETPNAQGNYYDRRTKKRMGHLYFVIEDRRDNQAAFHGLPTAKDGMPKNFGTRFHTITPWIITGQSNDLREHFSHDFGTERINSYRLPDDVAERLAAAQAEATLCNAMEKANLGYGTGALAILSEAFELALQFPGIRNVNNLVQPISNIATREMKGAARFGLKQFARAAYLVGFNTNVDPEDPYANSNSFFVQSMRALSGADPDLTFMKRVMHDTAIYMDRNNFAAPGSELDVAKIIARNCIADKAGAYALADLGDSMLGEGTTERLGNVAAGVAALGLAAGNPQLGPTMRHMLDVVQSYANNPWLTSEPIRAFADGTMHPVIAKATSTPQGRMTVFAAFAVVLGATVARAQEQEQRKKPQGPAQRPAKVPAHANDAGVAAAATDVA